MQPRGQRRVKFRDHAPEAGQSLGQFPGVGVPAPVGAGYLVDGCPEPGEPCLQSRTHDRSLGRRRHDRDAFRPGCPHDISSVDNDAPRVDGLTAQSFFLTHPVDGITAGDKGSVGRSFRLVLSTIPSPRTGRAACLHRLSTDLCTARLDAGPGPQKTVRTGR